MASFLEVDGYIGWGSPAGYDFEESLSFHNKFGEPSHKLTFVDEKHLPSYFSVIKSVDDFYLVYDWIQDKRSYLRIDDPKLQFHTWEQHLILSVAFIDFDDSISPLRIAPADTSSIYAIQDHDFVQPIEIKGEWLKVSLGYERSESTWLRWRTKNKLLLTGLYYFA